MKEFQNLLVEPAIANVTAKESDKAKITIVEFSDYQSTYSSDFFRRTEKKILDDFGNNGTVKFLLKDFVINDKEFESPRLWLLGQRTVLLNKRNTGHTMMNYLRTLTGIQIPSLTRRRQCKSISLTNPCCITY